MCSLNTICAKRGEIHAVAMKSAVAVLLPPMLLLHGDTDDIASSLGSVKLYEELYRRKIPAQLVIYSNAAHGLNANVNVRGWESRILDWLQSRKF